LRPFVVFPSAADFSVLILTPTAYYFSCLIFIFEGLTAALPPFFFSVDVLLPIPPFFVEISFFFIFIFFFTRDRIFGFCNV